MPTFAFRKHSPDEVDTAVVAVFAAKGDDAPALGADAAALGKALKVDLGEELAALRFTGEANQTARIPTRGKAKAPLALVVGLGSDPDVHALRAASGAAAKAAAKDADLAITVPGDLLAGEPGAAERTAAVVEGATLGAYAYTAFKSKAPDAPSLGEVALLAGAGLKGTEVKDAIAPAETIAQAVCLTRDLVNTPPQDKRPPALAERLAERAKEAGLKVKVHDEDDLAKRGFGGILGVGQGSSAPPRLVELTYSKGRPEHHLVLVGKGITFDTGGVSLKPSSGMATMKMDMAGAATTFAAAVAIAELGLKLKVTTLLPLAENMPSGTAQRVSDVLTQYGGKTVEVMNTDAEGRLVLADALAYAAEQEPDAMIDVATLTGAQIVALGSKIAGLMGSDDDLLTALEGAAEQTGELVWRLPLPKEYREHLDSEVADLKNIGKGREAGTLAAGLFLKEFTAEVPWAHFDIAGPAFEENGNGPLQGKGGTGMGVRTLVAYACDLAD
ncbi:MAG: leucyl aminopeptidase [Actinomycetota bacterium]